MQSLQYWLGGNAANLEGLLLNVAQMYVPALKGADFAVAEPQLFPDVGIWHPLAPSARPARRAPGACTQPAPHMCALPQPGVGSAIIRTGAGAVEPSPPALRRRRRARAAMYEDVKEYLNWYDTRSDLQLPAGAPIVGLVLQRSHLVTGDEGHYSGVVSELEARGAKARARAPITIAVTTTEDACQRAQLLVCTCEQVEDGWNGARARAGGRAADAVRPRAGGAGVCGRAGLLAARAQVLLRPAGLGPGVRQRGRLAHRLCAGRRACAAGRAQGARPASASRPGSEPARWATCAPACPGSSTWEGRCGPLARAGARPCWGPALTTGRARAQAVEALKKLNVPYLVSLPLVFQTTEEWLESELGVHPVQVALQARAPPALPGAPPGPHTAPRARLRRASARAARPPRSQRGPGAAG